MKKKSLVGWTYRNWSGYKDGKYQQGIQFVRSYPQRTCEYGFPEQCNEEAVLQIPWGVNSYPGDLCCCEKHIVEMDSPFIGWAYKKHIEELKCQK